MNEFDAQFEDERKDLAEIEYQDPLIPTLGDEEDMELIECTCIIDPDFCELHKLEDEEE